jgi:hypothetical protein
VRKRYRTVVPPELLDAVATHARAAAASDLALASSFVDETAAEAHGEALVGFGDLGREIGYAVIARARIGSQFIVKVRFDGAARSLTLQIRWRLDGAANWRIVEVNDLATHRPWKRPEKPEAVISNA